MLTVRKLIFLLFFLAVFDVDGAQDANISFDSKGFDYCLAVDNLTYYTCYLNQTLTVDGTQDHRYYIIPKPVLTELTGNETQDRLNELIYIINTPITFILANIWILGILFILAVVILWNAL